MEITNDGCSLTYLQSFMFLSIQLGLSFASAAIACAMRERISSLDPSSVMIVHSFYWLSAHCDITCCMTTGHDFGFLCTYLRTICLQGTV